MKNIINPLEKSLAGILNKAVAGIESGIYFLSAELPNVAHELLLWKMWESVLTNLIVLTLAFIVPLTLSLKTYKKGIKDWQKEEFSLAGVIFMLSSVWMLVGIIPLCTESNLTWLQILVAPKLYLVEYAAKLIGGN